MNYILHYNRLISRSKNRIVHVYTEKHHIIPRCMGGTDDADNIVKLTPEEHYVAHQLLVKINPNHQGLVWAMIQMTGGNHRNNKLYGWARRRMSKCAKSRTGIKNGSFGRSWYHCPNTLTSGKFSLYEIPNGWRSGRVPKIIKRRPIFGSRVSWSMVCLARHIQQSGPIKNIDAQRIFKLQKRDVTRVFSFTKIYSQDKRGGYNRF